MLASEKIYRMNKNKQLSDQLDKLENLKIQILKKRPSTWSFEESKLIENFEEDKKNILNELNLLNS